jgi:hypothetical protein
MEVNFLGVLWIQIYVFRSGYDLTFTFGSGPGPRLFLNMQFFKHTLPFRAILILSEKLVLNKIGLIKKQKIHKNMINLQYKVSS